ncbi:hypothetical protein KAI78_06470 [bacterium]|nr:hypothetical protein [bacterium]
MKGKIFKNVILCGLMLFVLFVGCNRGAEERKVEGSTEINRESVDRGENGKIVVTTSDKPEEYEYIEKIIIEEEWGQGKKQVGGDAFEGESLEPKSFQIDNSGQVLLFDYINNRIKVYNKDGESINIIPVESYKRSTKEEVELSKRHWNTSGYDFRTICADEILLDKKDNIYIKKQIVKVGEEKIYKSIDVYFKFSEPAWEKTEKEQYEKVKKHNRFREKAGIENHGIDKEEKNYQVIVENLNGNVIFQSVNNSQNVKIFQVNVEENEINYLFLDEEGFIYFGFKTLRSVKKYRIETGELEANINIPGYPSQLNMEVTGKGDIYVLEYIPDLQAPESAIYAKGIRLIKYELVKEQ